MHTRSLLLLVLSLLASLPCAAELTVHTDFEGGSARNVQVDQAAATIRMMPGGDSLRGWPCWWYVRVEGATAGQTVTLELLASDQPQHQTVTGVKGKPLGAGWSRPPRPFVSTDEETWDRAAEGRLDGDKMIYPIIAPAAKFWAAWGPVFTGSTGDALIERLVKKHPALASRFVLATTREGRPVPAIRIAAGAGKPAVWLQARQHAWESGGSWVGAGVLEWVLSDDKLAAAFREKAEIVVVPVMDVDHVATGDGGKDAMPQDHNRDWKDQPHWPEVAAAQKHLLQYAQEKRLRVFGDLHNPAPGDKKAFFFVSPKDMLSPAAFDLQKSFIDLCRQEFAGNPIPLEITPRESGSSYHPLWKQISKNWVHEKCGEGVLSLTLETAWHTPGSDVEGYQKTGAALGRALARFVMKAE